MKFVTDLSKGILGRPDPTELWEDITSYIPDELLLKDDVKILCVACGHGTEATVLGKRMHLLGRSAQEINDSIYLLDKYNTFINALRKDGWKNVITGDFLNWKSEMKFDVVVGNPPFNQAGDKVTIAGVSGKTRVFIDFTKVAASLVAVNGYLAFITPKGITNTLNTDPLLKRFDCLTTSWMLNIDHWQYDTCYFVMQNTTSRTKKLSLNDFAVSKFIDLDGNGWKGINQNLSNKEFNDRNVWNNSGQRVIRYLPGIHGPKPTYDYTDSNMVIPFGPKVIMTHLNSNTGILATNDPCLVGTSMTFTFDSITEAESFEKFLKNNPIITFLKKIAKIKKLGTSLHRIKKFNVTQIQTGKEYPAEWNLTQKEIEYIESTIK